MSQSPRVGKEDWRRHVENGCSRELFVRMAKKMGAGTMRRLEVPAPQEFGRELKARKEAGRKWEQQVYETLAATGRVQEGWDETNGKPKEWTLSEKAWDGIREGTIWIETALEATELGAVRQGKAVPDIIEWRRKEGRWQAGIVDVKLRSGGGVGVHAEIAWYVVQMRELLKKHGKEGSHAVDLERCGIIARKDGTDAQTAKHLLKEGRETTPILGMLVEQAEDFLATTAPDVWNAGTEWRKALPWHVGRGCRWCGWYAPKGEEGKTGGSGCEAEQRKSGDVGRIAGITPEQANTLREAGMGSLEKVVEAGASAIPEEPFRGRRGQVVARAQALLEGRVIEIPGQPAPARTQRGRTGRLWVAVVVAEAPVLRRVAGLAWARRGGEGERSEARAEAASMSGDSDREEAVLLEALARDVIGWWTQVEEETKKAVRPTLTVWDGDAVEQLRAATGRCARHLGDRGLGRWLDLCTPLDDRVGAQDPDGGMKVFEQIAGRVQRKLALPIPYATTLDSAGRVLSKSWEGKKSSGGETHPQYLLSDVQGLADLQRLAEAEEGPGDGNGAPTARRALRYRLLALGRVATALHHWGDRPAEGPKNGYGGAARWPGTQGLHPDLAGVVADEHAEWETMKAAERERLQWQEEELVGQGEAIRVKEGTGPGGEEGWTRWQVEGVDAQGRMEQGLPLAVVRTERNEGKVERRVEGEIPPIRWIDGETIEACANGRALEGRVLIPWTPAIFCGTRKLHAAATGVNPEQGAGVPGWNAGEVTPWTAGHAGQRLLWGEDGGGPPQPLTALEGIQWEGAAGAMRPALDRAQMTAARRGVTERVSVVWGPPGTGKTHTLAATVAGIFAARPEAKVVLCGATWTAIRALATRVDKACAAAGVGTGTVERVWLGDSERHPGPERWRQEKWSKGWKETAGEILEGAAGGVLVAGTARRLQQVEASWGADWTVLDEAAQCPPADLVRIAAMGGPQGRWILGGDPLQLGPIRKTGRNEEAPYLQSAWTLARHVHGNQAVSMLDRSYRAGRRLVEVVRLAGYESEGGRLESAVPARRLAVAVGGQQDGIDSFIREVLRPEAVAIALVHEAGRASTEAEAMWIARAVAALAAHGVRCGGGEASEEGREIGVVGLHRRQNVRIRERLCEAVEGLTPEIAQDMVRTAERFQGGERDVILVACGVGEASVVRAEEDFLSQLTRWNVAVSRAKCKVVQIVEVSVLRHVAGTLEAAEQGRAIRAMTSKKVLEKEEPITMEGPGGEPIRALLHWTEQPDG